MSHKRFVETGRSIHSILNTRNEVLAHGCCAGLLLHLPFEALDINVQARGVTLHIFPRQGRLIPEQDGMHFPGPPLGTRRRLRALVSS